MKGGVFVRNPYNYDTAKVSDETGLKCEDESLTLQSHAEDADINVMMRRFIKTGVLPQARRLPTYGDFSDIGTYREALDRIRVADDSFMSLDPAIRARFGGDPAAFVDFCSDPANLPELRRMGLAPKEVQSGEAGESDAVASKPRGGGDKGGSRSRLGEGEPGGRQGGASGSSSEGSRARGSSDSEER